MISFRVRVEIHPFRVDDFFFWGGGRVWDSFNLNFRVVQLDPRRTLIFFASDFSSPARLEPKKNHVYGLLNSRRDSGWMTSFTTFLWLIIFVANWHSTINFRRQSCKIPPFYRVLPFVHNFYNSSNRGVREKSITELHLN